MPVEARDDTLGYRLSKFVARNKLTVGAATVTMIAVVAGLGISLWQFGIARNQTIKAQEQLVRADAVSDFLGDILLSPSVNWDGALQTGPTVTIADVLAAAEIQLDSELTEYPEVRLELYYKIGEAFERMELREDGLRVQKKAVQLAESELPESSPLRVDAYYFLATVLLNLGNTQEAIDYFSRALDLANRQSSEETLRKLYIYNDLAVTYSNRREYEKSLELQLKAIEASYVVLGSGLKPPHTLGYLNLASVYISLGRFEESRKSLETNMEAFALYPEQTASIGAMMFERQARLDIINQELDQAQSSYRRAIELYDSSFGVPNTSSAVCKMRLANTLIYSDDFAGARVYIDQIEQQFSDILDDPKTWSYYLARGHLALAQGNNEEALRQIHTAIEFGFFLEMSRFDRTEAKWLLVRALLVNNQQAQAMREYKQLLETESVWIADDTAFKQSILKQAF